MGAAPWYWTPERGSLFHLAQAVLDLSLWEAWLEEQRRNPILREQVYCQKEREKETDIEHPVYFPQIDQVEKSFHLPRESRGGDCEWKGEWKKIRAIMLIDLPSQRRRCQPGGKHCHVVAVNHKGVTAWLQSCGHPGYQPRRTQGGRTRIVLYFSWRKMREQKSIN